jgi:hypothetical protein
VVGAEERSRLLADLASALITASTDLDQVVDTAARAVSQLIGDGAVVRLANDQGVFDRVAVHHPDIALAQALRRILPRAGQRVDEGFAAEVRAAEKIVIRNDLTTAMMQTIAGPLWPYLQPLNYGAVMTVPLIVDGAYLGTMSCGQHRRPDRVAGCDRDARVQAKRTAVSGTGLPSVGQRQHRRSTPAGCTTCSATPMRRFTRHAAALRQHPGQIDTLAAHTTQVQKHPSRHWHGMDPDGHGDSRPN